MTGPDDRTAAGSDRLRAGHADRERVVQALKDAFVQDRLTRDELDARAGLALTARTLAELAALTGDIPAAPAGPAAAGLARPAAAARPPAAARPSLLQRHPLVWGFAGAGSGVAIAFGLVMFAANVLDPHGLGNPYHPWSKLCALVAFAALLTGIGILLHGLGTAEEQRRARKQLPLGGPGGA
jgi:hypothetical protein